MANQNAVIDGVFRRVLKTISDPAVPVANVDARQVADAVASEIAPIVVNASNSEPFYRSRIFLGLGAAAVSFVTSKVLGFTVGENDIAEWVDIVLMLIEAWGLFYAWYGRKIGATAKPLGA